MSALAPGDMAPSFEAYDQDENLHDLEDYEGEWVVLYFYPKDDTPGCTTEACSFRDSLGALKDKAVVLGVSADSMESHKKFAEKYHLNFPLLADPDQYIIEAYGADGIMFPKRTTFLISPEGMIQKVYRDVDPETHTSEILQDVTLFRGSDE